MTTPAEAINSIQAYFTNLNADRQQYRNWVAGTPTGGPAGDGKYPLTTFDGTTYQVACPAKAVADLNASGGLNLSGFDNLATATQSDVTAAGANIEVVAKLGTGSGAALKRFTPFLFASRKTADLNETASLLATDMLQVHRADGSDWKVPMSILQTHTTGKINVKDAPYNAKGDYLEVRDAVATSGSNIISSATNPWTAQDVGKLIYVGSVGSGRATMARTISAFIDSGHVQISGATSAYSAGSLTCGWGTDDTTALRAAHTAAAPPINSPFSFGAVVEYPPGGYLTDDLTIYARTAVFGYGERQSVIVRKPSSSTNPTVTNATMIDDFQIFINMGIYGCKTLQSGAQRGLQIAVQTNVNLFPQLNPFPKLRGVFIWETSGDGLTHSGAGDGEMIGVHALYCSGYGYKNFTFDMNIADLYVEGCSRGGVWCGAQSANNNFNNVKVSFCGQTRVNAEIDNGMNIYDGGAGNMWNNSRAQESWGDNWVIAGRAAMIRGCRSEDTGNMKPGHGLGAVPSASTTRAAVRIDGACVNADIDINVTFGITAQAATHALYVSGGSSTLGNTGNPTYNRVRMHTYYNMRADTDYYNGGTDPTGASIPATTGVYTRGLVGKSITAIDSSNDININGNTIT